MSFFPPVKVLRRSCGPAPLSWWALGLGLALVTGESGSGVWGLFAADPPPASGQTGSLFAAVSYQGRLGDGGTPANGSYDFQFLLKNAAIAGDTVGAVIRQTLSVQSGVFSTSLPLEPSSFPGANRWIEVRVRPTPAEGSAVPEETAPFAVLERQRIQATPYAFRALSAATVESVSLQSLPPSVPVLDAEGRLSISLIPDAIARTNAVFDLGGVFQVALQSTNAATLAAIAALDQRQTGLSNAVALLKDGQTSHASRLAVLEAQQVYVLLFAAKES